MHTIHAPLTLYPDPVIPWNADTFHGIPHYETYRRRTYVYAGVDPQVVDAWAWSRAWSRVQNEAHKTPTITAPAPSAQTNCAQDEACRYDDLVLPPGPLAFWTTRHEWPYKCTAVKYPPNGRYFPGSEKCGLYGADAAPYFSAFRDELQAGIDAVAQHIPLETIYTEHDVDTEIGCRAVHLGRQIRAEIEAVGWHPGRSTLCELIEQTRRGDVPKMYFHIRTY